MISCTRILEFDAAHRVVNHESKCATLHGHRYKIEITAVANELDTIGRVIDFSVLKAKIGGWLDENWDHTTIVFKDDRPVVDALFFLPRFKDPFVADWNPTAENMARFLATELCPTLLKGTGIAVNKVVVWETPNCKAECSI
jgi:6-pyruvoyltetrahydropterin/6-carboxytetrahydropterin synthase